MAILRQSGLEIQPAALGSWPTISVAVPQPMPKRTHVKLKKAATTPPGEAKRKPKKKSRVVGPAELRLLRTLGTRIRDRRDAAKLTGKELAARADIPPATLSKIENGRQNATFLTLSSIAAALQCTVGELVADSPVTPPNRRQP